MKNIRGWSNILLESVKRTFTMTKTKNFCFRKQISYMEKCMCEGVGEDSRHGAWHGTFM